MFVDRSGSITSYAWDDDANKFKVDVYYDITNGRLEITDVCLHGTDTSVYSSIHSDDLSIFCDEIEAVDNPLFERTDPYEEYGHREELE